MVFMKSIEAREAWWEVGEAKIANFKRKVRLGDVGSYAEGVYVTTPRLEWSCRRVHIYIYDIYTCMCVYF